MRPLRLYVSALIGRSTLGIDGLVVTCYLTHSEDVLIGQISSSKSEPLAVQPNGI